jgi:hypothetical protein
METENMLGPGSELFVPRVAPPRPAGAAPAVTPAPLGMAALPVGLTTASASAGESFVSTKLIPGRNRQKRRLLVGALCGAIAVVVVLIVMVARDSGLEVAQPAVAPPPQQQIVAPAAEPRPTAVQVTPIEDQAGDRGAKAATAQAGAQEPGTQEPKAQEPGTQEPGTQEPGTQEPGTEPGGSKAIPGSKQGRGTPAVQGRGKQPPKTTKTSPKDGAKAGSGSAAAQPDGPPDSGDKDDDQWGRMHHDHDQPKEKTP